jgi:hypothetical protein
VTTRKQHRNGTAHRIPNGNHRVDSECFTDGCCVIGAIFECEVGIGAQTSTMAAMVDASYRRMRCEVVICGEKVEVA